MLGISFYDVVAVSDVRFARSNDVDIAYQIVGDGDIDIVLLVGWASHLEVLWELAEARRFMERLAGMGRLIMFDKRGTGLSDRPAVASTVEDMVPDLMAVMDAAHVEAAVLVGWSDGAAIAVEATAQYPDRVTALVVAEALASATPDQEHPWGPDPDMIEGLASAIELEMWGKAAVLSIIAPSVLADSRITEWFQKLERMSATPRMAADLLRRTMNIDVRAHLADIQVPCLFLHRKEALIIPRDAMLWFADQVPDGRYVELPGDELPGYLGDVDGLMDEIEDFLVGTRTGAQTDRRVATVLFSDVVDSTGWVASLGDRRWQQLLESHRDEMHRLLERHAGKEIGTAGDGFLIVFDSPTSALLCASKMSNSSRKSGLETRIGIHSGEVTYTGDELSGLAVHVAARVEAAAQPGEVWVTATVKDVLLGSPFQFESRGRHDLKGVPGTWELFRMATHT